MLARRKIYTEAVVVFPYAKKIADSVAGWRLPLAYRRLHLSRISLDPSWQRYDAIVVRTRHVGHLPENNLLVLDVQATRCSYG